jgi:hypothetical protein
MCARLLRLLYDQTGAELKCWSVEATVSSATRLRHGRRFRSGHRATSHVGKRVSRRSNFHAGTSLTGKKLYS